MAWTLPEGYEVIPSSSAPGVTLVAAVRARSALLLAGVDHPELLSSGPAVANWVDGGRVRHPVLSAGDEFWILKAYRRGGFFARWNPDRYWRLRRFMRELETAVRAVHAGVPAPEPIALVLRTAGWGGAFRAWQVVRYLQGVRSLREFLDNPSKNGGRPPPLSPIFRAAGAAVRRMHDAQIDHPDLNIGNILARLSSTPSNDAVAEAFIVDWDRARLRPAGSWNPHRNLLRLFRSALKLARLSKPGSRPDSIALRAFLHGYFEHNRRELRSLREYVRPRLALMALRAFFWDMARLGRVG